MLSHYGVFPTITIFHFFNEMTRHKFSQIRVSFDVVERPGDKSVPVLFYVTPAEMNRRAFTTNDP